MSGLKAVREIRQMEGGFHLGYTPILFLSGNDTAGQIDLGYEAGGDGYLSKPFTSNALIGALDGILRATNRSGLQEMTRAL